MPGSLLRVATAGSVDDGKSTLIGRLLHDAKVVMEDTLDAVRLASGRRGAELDLSLITDGLRAEREQGITIDVAYRYFATPRRTFVLADTPGHVQYTRNMVTGASTADAAVVLVDVRHGLTEQTRRHAYVTALLGVPHVVLAVNKMDLVGYDAGAFRAVADAFGELAAALGLPEVVSIPVSALHGDNVVDRSARIPGYDGPALLEYLEEVPEAAATTRTGLRLPVQYVIRHGALDYRGYAGSVAGGVLAPGDEVLVLPGGGRATVAGVDTFDGPLPAAAEPQAVVVRLAEAVDVGRGDLLAAPGDPPRVVDALDATVCWLAEAPLSAAGRYLVQHTTRTERARLDAVHGVVNVTSGELEGGERLGLNDIGRVRLTLAGPLAVDSYADNRRTGSFIVIDEATGATVGAGLVA